MQHKHDTLLYAAVLLLAGVAGFTFAHLYSQQKYIQALEDQVNGYAEECSDRPDAPK